MAQQSNDPTESNPLAFIPLVVWKLTTGLILFFLALCFLAVGYYHHASMQDFLSSGLTVFFYILKVGAGAAIIGGLYVVFHMRHRVQLKRVERKVVDLKVERQALQNEMLRQQLKITEALPDLLRYAMTQGHNIEVSPKLDVKVTNYLSNVHAIGGPGGQPALVAPGSDYLPEPYKLSSVLNSGWQPSKDGILLAKGQELITVPIGEKLCHTTFTGNTDSGKTNNERFLMLQLLFLQQIVYLCDRNYQRYRQDRKTGAVYDYSPIEAQLASEPIDRASDALALMKYLYSELEDRRIARKKAIVHFPDVYLFIDELPAFCGDEPEIMDYVGRFLRESRQYGIFFVGAAQDLLNQTLNNDNGAVRENLLTNFYGGGDSTTARLVLNLARKETIDETGLGQLGVIYLRAKGAGIERVKARTPLADNEATFTLLAGMQPREKREIPRVVESEPPAPREQVAHEPGIQEAIAAYKRGATTVGLLEKALHVSHYKAYEFYKQITAVRTFE